MVHLSWYISSCHRCVPSHMFAHSLRPPRSSSSHSPPQNTSYAFDMFGESPQYTFVNQLKETILHEEVPDEQIYKALGDVKTPDEVWDWLRGPFLSNVMTCENADPWKVFDMSEPCNTNGGHFLRYADIKVRALQTKPTSCGDAQFDLTRGMAGCGASIGEGTTVVDRAGLRLQSCLGPGTSPSEPGLNLQFHDGSLTNYNNRTVSGVAFAGKYGSYPPGGYMVYFTERANSLLENASVVQSSALKRTLNASIPTIVLEPSELAARKRRFWDCLQASGVVNAHTRLLEVQTIVMNGAGPPVGIQFATISISFEFSPVGGLNTRLDVYEGDLLPQTLAMELMRPPAGFPTQCRTDRCRDIGENHLGKGGMRLFDKLERIYGITNVSKDPGPGAPAWQQRNHESWARNHESWATRHEPRPRIMAGAPYINPDYHWTFWMLLLIFYFIVQELEEVCQIGAKRYVYIIYC